ncbi:MAG: hypothetical protein ACR2NA_07575 [Solirubrobacterales bacterium]
MATDALVVALRVAPTSVRRVDSDDLAVGSEVGRQGERRMRVTAASPPIPQ